MNIFITIFEACLYLFILTPVQTHYIYGDNLGTGFVSLNNGGHNYPSIPVKQRTYMMGSPSGQIYQKPNIERTAISKSPPLETTPNENDKVHRPPPNQKATETPNRPRNKDEGSYKHGTKNLRDPIDKSSAGSQNYHTPSNARIKEHKSQTKQYEKNHNANKVNMYDSKGNIVQVNVHKTQIPADPLKVKMNSNRQHQLTALNVQRREDYKRVPTSVLVDKTLQKGANIKDRNAQIMSRVLDDMTKKVSDRRIKHTEYKKRDTDTAYEMKSSSNSKRNTVSDMKKYIGKDKNMANHNKDTHKAGNLEEDAEEKENNNAPYALFYRMSPESLDNQEGFYLMKSMEDDSEKTFNIKEKRLSMNFDNEVDVKKAKPKKNHNTVKLRKKVKNFSSFRNNNNL